MENTISAYTILLQFLWDMNMFISKVVQDRKGWRSTALEDGSLNWYEFKLENLCERVY